MTIVKPTEEQVLRDFDTCSNCERWGPDDTLGTINYITHPTNGAELGYSYKPGKV